MVYKKYVYKKGKRHGPYYYHSYRQENQVKKAYIGGKKEYREWLIKRKGKEEIWKSRTTFQPFFSFMKNKLLIFIFLVILLTVIIGFFPFQKQITGKISLEIKDSYVTGKNITGMLKIELKKGELLPLESKIVIRREEFVKEIPLSNFVSANFNGSFFLENVELSGEGEGYGFPGEKITYPTVFFKLKVYEIREKSEEKGEIQEAEITESSSKEETEETRVAPIEEPAISTPPEMPIEEPTISTPPEMPVEEAPVDMTTETETTVSEAETPEAPVEEALTETMPLTGQVIEESVYYIEGSCSKERPFIYKIEEGETAEIEKRSVEIEKLDEEGKTKKEKLEDGIVTLQISGNQVRVETDYSIIEQKFGKDFLQDEKEYLEIDLENIEIEAQQGTLTASLVYQGKTLAEISKEINVEQPQIIVENITEETIKEKIAEINATTNITIITTQEQAVIGSPVKWKKQILLEKPENITIKLPQQAENIAVKSITEIEDVEIEEDITSKVGITGEIISGGLLNEFEVGRQGILTKLWKKFIGKIKEITGLVVDVEENHDLGYEREIELTLEENATIYKVTYETPAPYSIEEETAKRKRITISGPEELHYENILAYTELPETANIKNPSLTKIYWMENKSFLQIEKIEDKNNDGIYDHIEWLVPYLSNQTFEIIYITKALHLDENRSFISDIYNDVREKDDNWSEPIYNNEYVRVTFEKNLTRDKDITIYARASNCSENSVNNSIIVNGTEVPCDIYQKKKRIDEIRRLLEN